MSRNIETRDWIYYPDENVVRYREGVDYAYPFSGFPEDYPPLPAVHEKHISELFMNTDVDFFTEMDKRIFKNREKPVRVELSKSIKYIQEESFSATTISSLIAPRGSELREIMDSAFDACNFLTEVDLEHTKMNEISDLCFFSCIKLSSIKLPKKLKYIGEKAFSGCISLSQVEFPDTLERIESAAFLATNNLKEINIPPSVKKIGDRCFSVVLSNVTWRQTPIEVHKLLTFIRMTDNTTDLGRDCFLRTVAIYNASIILLGRLQPGNEDFPNHPSFITCHRRAQLDLPIRYPDRGGVSDWGTCTVSQNWRPKQTIPYETTLLDHNINKKLTFSIDGPRAASLGYGLGLDLTGMPIDQDLKVALANEYPDLGQAHTFVFLLQGEINPRESLTLRQLLEEAIIGNIKLTTPIRVLPYITMAKTPSPTQTYFGGPKTPSPINQPIRSPSQHPMTPARSLAERAISANIRFVNPRQSASFGYVVPPTVAPIDQQPLNARYMPQFDGLLTVDELRRLPTQRPKFSPPRSPDTSVAALLEDPNSKSARRTPAFTIVRRTPSPIQYDTDGDELLGGKKRTRRIRRHRGTRKRRHKKRTRGKRKRKHRTKKH